MSKQLSVSVVIPNWNGYDKLKRNIPEVLKVKGVSEVIVSDDASTDKSVELLKTEFPQVKVILRKENGGFSSNVNTGFRAATGDLVFLLNSDATPKSDCLTYLLPHFKDKKVFGVGCNTGGSWNWAKFRNGYFWHNQSSEKVTATHETLWAGGGSSLFRKSIWDKLHGLDELMDPFYEEDTDLGYRSRKRGYINLWEPKAIVEHYKEVGVIAKNFSQKTIGFVAQRNQLIFIWKNMTDNGLIRQHILYLILMMMKHPKYFFIVLAALKKLPKIYQLRQIEIKESTVSDKEILGKYSLNTI